MKKRHINVALFVPHEGCPHRCSFCDQRAISGSVHRLTAEEVTAACRRAIETAPADSDREIAFFGGSFTAIDIAYRQELLQAAQPFVKAGDFRGIRISTRPDAVDDDVLDEIAACGVTAVELGAQSMDDRVLQLNERGHTAAAVVAAVRRIRQHGMSPGLQMMTGLYGDTPEGACETARKLAALQPDTMRIYPTMVMKHTRLEELYRSGDYIPPTLDETVDLCTRLLTFFEQERGIPVIRLGLHADVSMQNNRVAGAFHPAFRELCEAKQYADAAERCLKRILPQGGTVTICVPPEAVSRMTGQKRSNIDRLRQSGYIVRVKAEEALPPRHVMIHTGSDDYDLKIAGNSGL